MWMLLLEVLQSSLQVMCPSCLTLLLITVFGRSSATLVVPSQLSCGLINQFQDLLLFCKAVLMLQQSSPQSLQYHVTQHHMCRFHCHQMFVKA